MSVPLVYATSDARRQAEAVLPLGAVLEREVARAILADAVRYGARPRVEGPGWVAHVRRVPGHLRRKPRAWLVERFDVNSES